jgi:hypothetical protein
MNARTRFLSALLGALSLFCLPAQAATFQNLNGVMWFQTTAEGIRYAELTQKLDDLKKKGIRVLGIYSPYHGDKQKWHGCAPLDFYNVPPANGTLQDFRALVAAAHARGMKVVAYFTNIFLDRNSPFFLAAEKQYAAGDRDSREVKAVRWSASPTAPLPRNPPEFTDPDGPEPKWAYSPTAKAYYWSLWGEVGFDFQQPGTRAEVEKVMRFWMETGLDGFMFDAGEVKEAYRRFMVELVTAYGGDKWITFESTQASREKDYHRFGLTSWFNFEDNDHVNDYVRVVRGLLSVDGLEKALRHADRARSLGKNTHAWAKWESDGDRDAEEEEEGKPFENEPLMRVQEAALLAGAGVLYGSPSSRHVEAWPASLRASWERVLETVNQNPALWPSASRERVTVKGSPKAYAFFRQSADRKQKALLVYNFTGQSQKLSVKLKSGSALPGQRAEDLYKGAPAGSLKGNEYALELPPWGFAMLGLK